MDNFHSKPFMLRILPLGASITQGYQSADGNGYRRSLRQQLRHAGWEVDMIGSQKSGAMHDNVSHTHEYAIRPREIANGTS